MNTFFRIAHPAFSWAAFFGFGIEAIQQKLYLPMLIVFLGLGGLSQSFWKSHLGEKQPYNKADVAAFVAGILPAIAYPLLAVWDFVFR